MRIPSRVRGLSFGFMALPFMVAALTVQPTASHADEPDWDAFVQAATELGFPQVQELYFAPAFISADAASGEGTAIVSLLRGDDHPFGWYEGYVVSVLTDGGFDNAEAYVRAAIAEDAAACADQQSLEADAYGFNLEPDDFASIHYCNDRIEGGLPEGDPGMTYVTTAMRAISKDGALVIVEYTWQSFGDRAPFDTQHFYNVYPALGQLDDFGF